MIASASRQSNRAFRWLRRQMGAQIAAATAIDKLPDSFGWPSGIIFVGGGISEAKGYSVRERYGHRILKCIHGHAVHRRVIRALERGTIAPPGFPHL